MVRYHNFDVVFAEIPGETTLALNITGCPNRCPGCHSPHLQADEGRVLDEAELLGLLARYGRSVTCVAFMGGDAGPHKIDQGGRRHSGRRRQLGRFGRLRRRREHLTPPMVRALPVLLLLLSAACGLAEDERDEKNRYIYLTFYDKAFEAYCLGEFDVDGDGRISRYEAQRVRTVECPERGVASLSDLKEFTRLERLDCRGNALTRLDVTMTRLEWLDCSDNGLVSLDVNGLRGLAYLDCGGNSLPRLDLQSNASLATLLCPDNALAGSLDVTSCASGLRADVRGNPSLATVYCLASQSVDFNGPTELVRK